MTGDLNMKILLILATFIRNFNFTLSYAEQENSFKTVGPGHT